MLNNIAVITARMASKRLPGKVLMDIHGRPVLWHVVQQANQIKGINDVLVATTSEDKEIVEWCYKNGVDVYKGPERDILDRIFQAVISTTKKAGKIVRIWGSCPLFDPAVADMLMNIMDKQKAEYIYNVGWPRGQACAVVEFKKLARDWKTLKDPKDREWYHDYCKKDGFAVHSQVDNSDLSWEIDTEEDLEFARKILSPIYFKVVNNRYAKIITHPRLEVVNRSDECTLLRLT